MTVLRRGFSSKSNQEDFFTSAASTGFRTFEEVRDLLYPEDQRTEQSNEEVVQEIIRSNYLASQTMSKVSKGLFEKKEQSEFLKNYNSLHAQSLEANQKSMVDANVRPSLLGIVGAPDIF